MTFTQTQAINDQSREDTKMWLFASGMHLTQIFSYRPIGCLDLCSREGNEHILAAEHWDSCNWLCAADWFVINDVTVSLIGGPEPDQQSGEAFNL